MLTKRGENVAALGSLSEGEPSSKIVTPTTQPSTLAIDALVSEGPQVQSKNSVAGRLAFVAQATESSITEDIIQVHITIFRVLTPNIQFSGAKEKGSPSYENEYSSKFTLYEENYPGREVILKARSNQKKSTLRGLDHTRMSEKYWGKDSKIKRTRQIERCWT